MSSVHWLLKSKKSSVSIIAAQRMTDLKEISSWNITPCNRVFFPLKYEVEYRLFFFYVLKLSLLSYMSFYFEWLGILGILRLFKKLTKPLVHAQFHLAYNQNFSTGTGEPVDYKNIIFDRQRTWEHSSLRPTLQKISFYPQGLRLIQFYTCF